MIWLSLSLSLLALIGSGISLHLIYQAKRKLQIVKSVPCIHCNRSVPLYHGEAEGHKECNQCQARRRR